MSRDKGTAFKRHQLFIISGGCLFWWGSYDRKGNALRYLKEMGTHGLRVMEFKEAPGLPGPGEWLCVVDGVVSKPDTFTSRLLDEMIRFY
jgi:hypothetical protein